jgi:predicted nucleic acid-binding protein
LSFADSAIVALARARDVRHVASFDMGFARLDGIELVPSRKLSK